jgi:hypothetical protein
MKNFTDSCGSQWVNHGLGWVPLGIPQDYIPAMRHSPPSQPDRILPLVPPGGSGYGCQFLPPCRPGQDWSLSQKLPDGRRRVCCTSSGVTFI